MSGRGVTRFVNAKVCRDGVLVREDLWVADATIVDAQSRFFNVRDSDSDNDSGSGWGRWGRQKRGMKTVDAQVAGEAWWGDSFWM